MARVYLSPPHLSGREIEYVRDAIDSNWIIPLGPQVDAFERELGELAVGVPHALALASGTAALHLALVVLGIGPGDEVACSDLTFAASANAIVYSGATPVLRRLRRDAGRSIPPSSTARSPSAGRPGRRVRAVVAVDLYGQCCDYDAIRAVCERHERPLVQDAAESLGATLPRGAVGGQGALAPSRSTATRSSPRAAAASSSRATAPDRARAQALDAGARPGAALPALRARLQLPA